MYIWFPSDRNGIMFSHKVVLIVLFTTNSLFSINLYQRTVFDSHTQLHTIFCLSIISKIHRCFTRFIHKY